MSKLQGFPLFHIFDIPIDLDASWLLMAALITGTLALSYYPAEIQKWPPELYWILGFLTVALLFGSLIVHVIGQSWMALRSKVPLRKMSLFIFGGVPNAEAEPPSPAAEVRAALSGPAVSLLLAGLFFLAQLAVRGDRAVGDMFQFLVYANLAIAIFDLIPGFPLDGGEIVHAILWKGGFDARKATLISTNLGRVFALLILLAGVWQMAASSFGIGLLIATVGVLLEIAASSHGHLLTLHGRLAQYQVVQAMSLEYPNIPADISLQTLVEQYKAGDKERAFVVEVNDDLRGLLTHEDIYRTPRSEWKMLRAVQAMLPVSFMKSVEPQASLEQALEKMDEEEINFLLVKTGNQVTGLISRHDILHFLQSEKEGVTQSPLG